MVETLLKSQFPDANQGPTLQVDFLRLAISVLDMLTLSYTDTFGSIPQESSENCVGYIWLLGKGIKDINVQTLLAICVGRPSWFQLSEGKSSNKEMQVLAVESDSPLGDMCIKK